jgi:hypothetical protein
MEAILEVSGAGKVVEACTGFPQLSRPLSKPRSWICQTVSA